MRQDDVKRRRWLEMMDRSRKLGYCVHFHLRGSQAKKRSPSVGLVASAYMAPSCHLHHPPLDLDTHWNAFASAAATVSHHDFIPARPDVATYFH
jgi:hypothetical protein